MVVEVDLLLTPPGEMREVSSAMTWGPLGGVSKQKFQGTFPLCGQCLVDSCWEGISPICTDNH